MGSFSRYPLANSLVVGAVAALTAFHYSAYEPLDTNPGNFNGGESARYRSLAHAAISNPNTTLSKLGFLGDSLGKLEPDSARALSTAGIITDLVFYPLHSRIHSSYGQELDLLSKQIGDLAAKLLTLAPGLPMQMLPDGILNIDAEKNRAHFDEALNNFTISLARTEFNRSVKTLVADFISIAHGEEEAARLISSADNSAFVGFVQSLEANVRLHLNAIWNRPDLMKTKYLGRAFVSSVYAQLGAEGGGKSSKYHAIQSRIFHSCKDRGITLANYLTPNLIVVDGSAFAAMKEEVAASTRVKTNADLFQFYSFADGVTVSIEKPRKSEVRYKEKMATRQKVNAFERLLFDLRQFGVGDGAMMPEGVVALRSMPITQKQHISMVWIKSEVRDNQGELRYRVNAPEQYLATKDVQIGKRRLHQESNLSPVEQMLSKFAVPRPLLSPKIADLISPYLVGGMLKQAQESANDTIGSPAAEEKPFDNKGLAEIYKNAFAALSLNVVGENHALVPFNMYKADTTVKPFEFRWSHPGDSKSDDGYQTLQAGLSPEVRQAQNEYQSLLRRWRFEDWTQEMEANLKKGPGAGYDTWINKIQLARNIKSYQAVNDAVELSSLIMAHLKSRLADPKTQIALTDIASRFLAAKPKHPPIDIPVEIKAMPQSTESEFDAREKAIEHFILQHQISNIEEHARAMLADITGVMYGRELMEKVRAGLQNLEPQAQAWQKQIEKIYRLCWKLSERMYMDALVWQANFLGQTLASLILIESERVAGGQKLAELLDTRIKAKALYLEHFFGKRFVQRNDDAKEISAEIADGTMLLTKNMAAESSAISHGASAANIERADEHDLVAGMDQIILTMGLGDYFAPLNPNSNNQNPMMIQKVTDWLTQKNELPLLGTRLRKGYSHIDYIYLPKITVKNAAGKEVTLYRKQILDAYPTHYADDTGSLQNAGGPRLSSLNQVIDRTWHSRALVAFRDPVEFRRAFLEETKAKLKDPAKYDENGFPEDGNVMEEIYEIEFNSKEFRPLKVGEADPQVSGRVGRHTKVGLKADISSEAFAQLHYGGKPDLAKIDAELAQLGKGGQADAEARAWHQRVTDIVHAKQEDMIKKGWIFMWVTERVHVRGMAYCSFYLDAAFRMSVGFTPEFEVGGYRSHIRSAGKMITEINRIALDKSKRGEELSFVEEKIKDAVASGATNEIAAAYELNHVVSPTALVINKGVPDRNIHDFDFEDRDAFERAQYRYRAYIPRDPVIEAGLESILPRAKYNLTANYEVDETEATHVVEEAITIPKSQGFKAIDIGEQGNLENPAIVEKRMKGQLRFGLEKPESFEVRSR